MGRNGSRLTAVARRALVVLVTLALAAGQWLGLLGPAATPALADDGTITGTCTLSGGRYDADEGYTANCAMPDGQVLTAHCYERYLGVDKHEYYLGPCDGTYEFKADRQPDGSYRVVVYSQDAACSYDGRPANGMVGHKFQHAVVLDWRPHVDVSFTKCSADARVTAGNSEYRLEGAEYDIFRASDNALITHIVTDSNGHASYQLSPNEHYYAVETKAPQGFQVNPNRIDFWTGDSVGDSQLPDDPGYVFIKIQKKDSATLGEAQPGATLEGAEYRIDSLSTPGWSFTITTDADGFADTLASDGTPIRVPFGKITVTEVKAPKGYRLDPTPHPCEVSANQMTNAGTYVLEPEDDFKETVVAFDLEVAKTKGSSGEWDQTDGQSRPAAGVQFQVISNTTHEVVGTLTTNASGFASTRDASTVNAEAVSGSATYDATKPWFGKGTRTESHSGAIPYDEAGYTIHEVESTVPDGYDHVDDWQVTADQQLDGSLLQYQVNDARLNTRLRIVKTDAESGQTVPLAGFTFQVLDADGKVVEMDDPYDAGAKVSKFTTDDSGQVSLPSRLEPGTYAIHEVVAQAPYVLSDDVEFAVPSDYTQATPLTTVSFPDRQATGQATITKTCTDPDGDCGGVDGTEYDVVATADVTSPDGTVQATEGEVVDHVTVRDGKATTRELPLGGGTATYQFVETKAASGHVLDSTPIPFTLSWKDDETEVVTAEATQADRPSETVIDKTVMGSGEALPGATFAWWALSDQLKVADAGGHALAVAAPEGAGVTLLRTSDAAAVSFSCPNGWQGTLTPTDGGESVTLDAGQDDAYAVTAGTYVLRASADGVDQGQVGDVLTVESGRTYDLSLVPTVAGAKAALTDTGSTAAPEALPWDADDGVYEADELNAGTYEVSVGGRDAGTVEVGDEGVTYAKAGEDGIEAVDMLLKGGSEPETATTGEDGKASIRHLAAGSYRMSETAAPAGYVRSDETYAFTVTDDGMTEGVPSYSQDVEDDYTKVHVSKRDVTNEAEVPGAKLTITDSDGNVVDSWTSTTEDHVINAMAPGHYTLTEEMTPNSYDKANSVEFDVAETGEVQSVVMYDEPISIEGQVDKRQEIADPTHDGTVANGDGQNRADVSASDDGSYDYTLDFRSTSSTWTDEFTVTDTLDCADAGLARLTGITTPVAWQDHDGKLNVWYKTNQTDDDYQDGSGANATLSDRHENPWLTDASTSDALGDDARALDYKGWRLWQADVDATTATDLSVSDLGLADGEYVTGIRLEYGRVEKGFTTRQDGWDRDDLKDTHDDLDDASDSASQNGTADVATDGQDDTLSLSPAFVHMQVTDDYQDGTVLENSASVDLYRNGGGEGLESHDEDKVRQVALSDARDMPQTGVDDYTAALRFMEVVTGIVAVSVVLATRRYYSA